MKKLLDKILVFIALMIAGLVPVYSADIFSHTVLSMPHDLMIMPLAPVKLLDLNGCMRIAVYQITVLANTAY